MSLPIWHSLGRECRVRNFPLPRKNPLLKRIISINLFKKSGFWRALGQQSCFREIFFNQGDFLRVRKIPYPGLQPQISDPMDGSVMSVGTIWEIIFVEWVPPSWNSALVQKDVILESCEADWRKLVTCTVHETFHKNKWCKKTPWRNLELKKPIYSSLSNVQQLFS